MYRIPARYEKPHLPSDREAPPPGKVICYKLSEEEIAKKYGPPIKKKKKMQPEKLSREKLKQELQNFSIEQIAIKYHTAPDIVKKTAEIYGLR